MNISTLYRRLNQPQSAKNARKELETFLKTNPDYHLAPFGGRVSNKSSITITSDAGRALTERMVNSFDSFSEKFIKENPEAAKAKSVKDLVNNYMGFDLSTATDKERVDFANQIGMFQRHKIYHGKVVKKGDGQSAPRNLSDREECISITDTAEGMTPKEMVKTGILSLHKSNKAGKPYLQGQYGQGGASSLSHCEFTFIASRKQGSDEIGYTAIFKQPAGGEYETSLWVMVVNRHTGLPITVTAKEVGRSAIECGTKITHFNYAREQVADNTARYGSPYHLFRRLLPNCEFPLYFDDCAPSKSKGSNRTLYGSFKALERKLQPNAQPKEKKKILFRTVGDKDGFIPVDIDGGKVAFRVFVMDNGANDKSRIPAFFEDGKQAIVTVGGQNQHTFDGRSPIFHEFNLLKKNMAVEIAIDGLLPEQRDELDVSTRERLKDCPLRSAIVDEVKRHIDAIPELHSLEDDFRKKATSNKVKSESGLQLLKSLGLFGIIGKGLKKAVVNGNPASTGKPRVRRPHGGSAQYEYEWKLSAVPTFIRFAQDNEITVYANDKSQYAYVYTDAIDLFDEAISVKVNPSNNLMVEKSSKLNNGSFRIKMNSTNCLVGEVGVVTITLTLANGEKLYATNSYTVKEQPVNTRRGRPSEKGKAKLAIDMPDPEVELVPVTYGSDAESILLDDKQGNLSTVAGRAIYDKTNHRITLWYSKEYVYYISCKRTAGGSRKADKFNGIVEKYISAAAVSDLVDKHSQKAENMDITVDWNTAMKMACFVATETLK